MMTISPVTRVRAAAALPVVDVPTRDRVCIQPDMTWRRDQGLAWQIAPASASYAAADAATATRFAGQAAAHLAPMTFGSTKRHQLSKNGSKGSSPWRFPV